MLSIPGVSPEDVDFFLGARADAVNQIAAPQLSGVDRYARVADLRAVTITARATVAGHVTFVRQAVVMVSPDLPLVPIRILQWRQPAEAPAETISLR